MEILASIPSTMILAGIICITSTQAVILWRLKALEKKLDNGISQKLSNLDHEIDNIKLECIKHHAAEYAKNHS